MQLKQSVCVRVRVCRFMCIYVVWSSLRVAKYEQGALQYEFTATLIDTKDLPRSVWKYNGRLTVQVDEQFLISVREIRAFQCRVVFRVASGGLLQTTNSSTLCGKQYDLYPIYLLLHSTLTLLLLTCLCLRLFLTLFAIDSVSTLYAQEPLPH